MMSLATDLSARLENQEEWRNEEKAKEENRTPKEVQQEQVVACAALVFAASSAAPFSIADLPRKQAVFLRNRFSNAGQDHNWL